MHVWRVPLDRSGGHTDPALSPDERERARRFRFERDRVAWATARSWLRRILARYLDCAPGALVFSSDARDKPTFLFPEAGSLRFNLSHSGAVGLIAVSAGNDVGIDVEHVGEDRDLVEIARRVFCASALDEVLRSSGAERSEIFHRLWVRNEARAKCEGCGLTDPEEPAHPTIACSATGVPVVLDLAVGDGYAAALATAVAPRAVRRWAPV